MPAPGQDAPAAGRTKPKSGTRTLAFVASDAAPAQEAARLLTERYGSVASEAADVIVALGGDGFMLEMLHKGLPRATPIFGMNRGSGGFLVNAYRERGLHRRLHAAPPGV